MSLKNAVEKAFTAKTPRAQRTPSKAKIHPCGEDANHPHFYSRSCFSYVPEWGIASLRLGGGIFIPTAFFRLSRPFLCR